MRTFHYLKDAEFSEPAWLVRDLLVKGTVNILWAMAGMGKSYFAIQLSVCLASGKPFLDFKIPDTGKCLYYCLEGGERGLAHRIKNYPPMDVSPEAFDAVAAVFSLSLATEADFEKLKASTLSWKAALVIIDPLSSVLLPRGWDWNDNSAVAPFMARLDRIAVETGACILLIHHKKKGPKDDTPNEEYDRSTATGAQSLVNLASTRMHIRGLGHGSRILYVFGKDVRLMELSIRHDEKEPYGPMWRRARGKESAGSPDIDLRGAMGLIRCGVCGIWSTEPVHDIHARGGRIQ